MRIGLMVDERGCTFADLIDHIRSHSEQGFGRFWLGQHTGWDALTALAAAGAAAPGAALGTAVLPAYHRHPLALAGQALTVQAATGGRLTLGVGVGHSLLAEHQFGHPLDRPAHRMREYLSALLPLLRGEAVEVAGDTVRAAGQIDAPGATAPSVLLAALGPAMLTLAGEQADGTVTMWANARALGDHVVPTITKAAAAAGRPAPQVVAGAVVCVTADPDSARNLVAGRLGMAAKLPSYRAILDRSGAQGPADVALVGDERTVEKGLRALFEAGATEVMAMPFGSPEDQRSTVSLLAGLIRTAPPATAG
jgi:F420-dependent oxidoreductase-like protein